MNKRIKVITKPEDRPITLEDLIEATKRGEVKWRKVEATNAFNNVTDRATYMGRIYILEKGGKLSVWNNKIDNLIWFSSDGLKLKPFI